MAKSSFQTVSPDRSGDKLAFGAVAPYFDAGVYDWGRPDAYPDEVAREMDQLRPVGLAEGPYPRAFHLFYQYVGSLETNGEAPPVDFHLVAEPGSSWVCPEDVAGVAWKRLPDSQESGRLLVNNADRFHAIFSGPRKPGLYRFGLEIAPNALPPDAASAPLYDPEEPQYFATAQILIPAAGAEVEQWLFDEINVILNDYDGEGAGRIGWAEHWKNYLINLLETQGGYPRTEHYTDAAGMPQSTTIKAEDVFPNYLLKIGWREFDYQGVAWDAIDSAPGVPWEGLNELDASLPLNPIPTLRYSYVSEMRLGSWKPSEKDVRHVDYYDPSFVTLRGVTIARCKLNLVLGSVFARKLGRSCFEIRTFLHGNQLLRGGVDSAQAQNAAQLGCDLFKLWHLTNEYGQLVYDENGEPIPRDVSYEEFFQFLTPEKVVGMQTLDDNATNLFPVPGALFDRTVRHFADFQEEGLERSRRFTVLRRPDLDGKPRHLPDDQGGYHLWYTGLGAHMDQTFYKENLSDF